MPPAPCHGRARAGKSIPRAELEKQLFHIVIIIKKRGNNRLTVVIETTVCLLSVLSFYYLFNVPLFVFLASNNYQTNSYSSLVL